MKNLQKWWARTPREFHSSWKNFLFQSVLAAITIFIVFLFLHREQAVIIAAIGGTAFIVFIMPSADTAKSQNVIGGHIIGFVSGMLGVLILRNTTIASIVVYALVVGISIFLMITLNLEHPPASGTALGVAISGFQSEILIAILTSTIILSLGHHFLRKYLKDLVK
jgi:CBS-domain-containing membrane protein